MTEKIRWGIIGCGLIASKFAEGLKCVDDAQLLAVGSRSKEKAEDFASGFGAERAYGSYEQLAADPDLDVVYIATPHPFHMKNTLLCIENGKAVLCEKPFAMNAAQSSRMIDAARLKKVFLMEAMWTRFIPATVRVRELIAEGTIGWVRALQADFGYRSEFDPASRIFAKELGGGALLDVGIYPVSFASMIFGRAPEQIAGLAELGKTGVDEQAAVVFTYDQGELAVVSTAVRTDMPGDAVIMGTSGMIRLHYPFWRSKRITIVNRDRNESVIEMLYESNGYDYEAREVHKCLREGVLESNIMSLDESLAIMETMDKIRAQWGLEYPADRGQ
jgi:predicted dehydrogenase